jgi:glycosyltransferase involved in cell wall biosynthesis
MGARKLSSLHVITTMDVGGAETMLYKLALAWKDAGHDVAIISLGRHGRLGQLLAEQGVRVIPLELKSMSGMLRLAKLADQIDFEPDVIQGWMYHGNIFCGVVRRSISAPAPIVWNIRQSLHTYSAHKLSTRLVVRYGRYFQSMAEKIIYNSHIARKHHEEMGYVHGKGLVIPNGFPVERFQMSTAQREAMRDRTGLDSNAFVVGIAGRNHPDKGYPDFFHAARIVLSRIENAEFVVAGRGFSHEDKEFTNIIPDVYRSRFHFLGELEDTAPFFTMLDVYVSSSRAEAFSNSIGEAMCTGLPCVVTDVGDSRRVVEGVGKVVQPRKPEDLAAGVVAFYENRDLRRQSGALSRQRIIEDYSLDRIVADYSELYGTLTRKKA